MHNLKYYLISLAAVLIVLAAIVNLKKTDGDVAPAAATETETTTQLPITQTINAVVDPAVVVASNSRLGINMTSSTQESDLVTMLKKFNPSYLREGHLLSDHSSIPEFLDLCIRVGANPWIVIPTGLGDAELDALGLYLGQNDSQFSNVILEVGNGNGNLIFSAEQIPYHDASFVDPAISRIASNAGSNVHLTIAQGLTQNEESPSGSGAALAKTVIDLLPSKPNPLMVSRASQAPTDLAVIMLNEVIGGSLHEIRPTETANLTMAAFRTTDHWTAAITSANPKSVDLVVQFPDDGLAVPMSANVLQAENVKIINQPAQVNQRNVVVTVPAYGFVVLLNPPPEDVRE